MPSKSKTQQSLMGMVHAVQKGEMEAPSAKVAAIAKSMKPKAVTEFASTKTKGMTTRAKKKK